MDQGDEGQVDYYRGVHVKDGRITAQVSAGRETHRLGRFNTREEAAKAYDEAATRMFTHPVLNFKADGSLNERRRGHSLYEGVSYHRRARRWYAHVHIYGVHFYITYANSEEEAYEAYCSYREMWTRYKIDEILGGLKNRRDGEVLLRAMMEGAERTSRLKPTIESHLEALRGLLCIAIQRGVVQ